MIRPKTRVKTRLFEALRKADQVFEIEVGVGIGARITPPCGVDADRAHKRAEVQLPCCRHPCRSPRCCAGDILPRADRGPKRRTRGARLCRVAWPRRSSD